jgi:hypothetical protein
MPTNQTKEINAIKSVVDLLGPFKAEERNRILRLSGDLSESSQENLAFPTDVMGALFAAFKESIEQTNSDKKYFLQKLAEYNKISEALGDYLAELAESLLPENGGGCNDDAENEVEVKSLSVDVANKLVQYDDKIEVSDAVFERTQKLRLTPKKMYVEIKRNLDLYKRANKGMKIMYQKYKEADLRGMDRIKLQHSALNAIKQISSFIQ